jgi:FkbM family methyltransferase
MLRIAGPLARWLPALLRRHGIELARIDVHHHAAERLRRLLRHAGIDLVLDVGANRGQFARSLRREAGYRGRIVSFEPQQAAFAALARAARGDPLWQTRQVALAERTGHAALHLTADSDSSSLRTALPRHRRAAPAAGPVGDEPVALATLDDLFPALRGSARSVLLKIDTQGYEREVLEGARASLRTIDTLRLEMPLAPLYDGEAGFGELYAQLLALGYRMVGADPAFVDAHSGEVLQIDGLFRRGP